MSRAQGQPGESDQRAFPRQRMVRFVWYSVLATPDAPSHEGVARSCDISAGGVGLVVTHPIRPGAHIFLEITTTRGNVSALGEVTHAAPHGEAQIRVGIRFLVVPPNDQVLLRKLSVPEERHPDER